MERGEIQASRPKLSQAVSLTPRSLSNSTMLLAGTMDASVKSALLNTTCIFRARTFDLTELAVARLPDPFHASLELSNDADG